MSKVTIVGAGAVGATTAFSLAELSIVDELVIVDIAKNKAYGNEWDIRHGVPLMKPVRISSSDDYSASKDSDIIIITVGVPEVIGESRLVPLKKNVDIIKSVVPELLKHSPNGKLLVVSNPVDLLTYAALKVSGLPKNRILGLGTVLDTSRFKCMLSRDFDIDPRCIQGYMLGEHGDSQIAAWSLTKIAGHSVEEYARAVGKDLSNNYHNEIEEEVKFSAFDVWQKKGPNCYCVAEAIKTVTEAILRNENSILSVSSLLEGEYGVSDICLSMPSIVGREGVQRTVEVPISPDELAGFQKSSRLLKDLAGQLNL